MQSKFTARLAEPMPQGLIRRLPASAGKSKAGKPFFSIVDTIHAANMIFEFDLDVTVLLHELLYEQEVTKTPAEGKPYTLWDVGYRCHVRVVADGITHDGIGVCTNQANGRGEAHAAAGVGAQSDAFKTAMQYFGDRFGLSLKLKEDLGEDILGQGYSDALKSQLEAQPPAPLPTTPQPPECLPDSPAPRSSQPAVNLDAARSSRTTNEVADDPDPTPVAQPALAAPSAPAGGQTADLRAQLTQAIVAFFRGTGGRDNGGRMPEAAVAAGIRLPKDVAQVDPARIGAILAGIANEAQRLNLSLAA